MAAGAGVAGCSGGSNSAAGSVVAPTGTTPPSTTPLIATEIDEWEKLLGSTFLIATDTGKVPAVLATLTRIADVSRPADLARHQAFFAAFQMEPRLAPVGSQTYRLSHTVKGDFDLFLGMSSEIQGKGVMTALLA